MRKILVLDLIYNLLDDILVYHRMSKDLEKQVIGRAQRLGRTVPLNITYLCHENEYPK